MTDSNKPFAPLKDLKEQFDPSELESTEQWGAPSVSINEEVIPDIQADPESAERINAATNPLQTQYPAFLFSKFHVDNNGDLAPNTSYVLESMSYYKVSGHSPIKNHRDGRLFDQEVVAADTPTDLQKYNEDVYNAATSLMVFNETAYTTVTGYAKRPCAGMINAYAKAAERLWGNWCLDRTAFEDLCKTSETDMTENQLAFKHNITTSLQLQGYNARFARDVLKEINNWSSTDYKVSEEGVENAIEFKLRMDAQYQTDQHKRTDVDAAAKREAPRLDKLVVSTF